MVVGSSGHVDDHGQQPGRERATHLPQVSCAARLRGANGLTVFVSAYITEVVRGAIESVPRGQYEAAEALGLGLFNKFRYVIVPQAMRVMVPPWVGILLAMIKDSSLVSVIGFVDLTQARKIVGTKTIPLGRFGRWYEKRLSISLARPPDALQNLVPAVGGLPDHDTPELPRDAGGST